ncbi:hypothetical protein COCC4DRAFT_33337 [Bipolaris maydis ATCC 48331]|uniref:Uncharacterized protein n=2 Tax=Cochliobolus heterostrophus TaxID=5016 RepID=M2UVR5_COCH5|nr:uncharacterized protein COCC4DRAFT_33337 [Bipolaris maydis ATCC 48331]EMD97666.1 hypothetical protein COCHEDRAFT_1019031 [Bipolaris maydis C5]ENI02937.1 hypothetical protein COCC4DRAFT_33337 [Bipolaris maydis ATCC 48331]
MFASYAESFCSLPVDAEIAIKTLRLLNATGWSIGFPSFLRSPSPCLHTSESTRRRSAHLDDVTSISFTAPGHCTLHTRANMWLTPCIGLRYMGGGAYGTQETGTAGMMDGLNSTTVP